MVLPVKKKVYLIEAEIHSMSTSTPMRNLIEQKLEVNTAKEAYDWIVAQAKEVNGWIASAKATPVDSQTGEVVQPAAPPPKVEKPCPLKDLVQVEVIVPQVFGLVTKRPNTCEEGSKDDSVT